MSYEPLSYYETARLTLRAILQYKGGNRPIRIFDEEAPELGAHASWATRLRIDGETTISWHVVADEDGLVDVSRSVSFLTKHDEPINHTVIVKQLDLAEMGNVAFSKALLQLIIGHDAIPLSFRREAREWEKVAEQDAAYIYAVGMRKIISDGLFVGSSWKEADDSEVFDMIREHAEAQVGRGLGDHKKTWRDAGVQFASADVYQDAFVNKAVELMNTLYVRE